MALYNFINTFIFIFNMVVSNNLMYFPLGFKRCSGLILSQKDLEHVFQPKFWGKYVRNESFSIMSYVVCFSNPMTVIIFELFLKCPLSNEIFVGYCTIVWKVLIAFSNWRAFAHRLYPEMQDLLIALMKRLINSETLEGKSTCEIIIVDVSNENHQFPLKKWFWQRNWELSSTVDR